MEFDPNELLKQIRTTGSAHKENQKDNPIILGSRNHLTHIIDLSSGLPRIRPSMTKKFSLILSQPLTLQELNPGMIRCCLCREVIFYPAWYYDIKYTVNHFHYFICFDRNSTNKPSARCYKR